VGRGRPWARPGRGRAQDSPMHLVQRAVSDKEFTNSSGPFSSCVGYDSFQKLGSVRGGTTI
jgi:hypothetical protein